MEVTQFYTTMRVNLQKNIGELEPDERKRCATWKGSRNSFFFAQIIAEQPPAMLVIVAVNTQVFPVRAIRGVIPGIPVLVVHGQEMPILIIELPGTFGADEPVDLE
jgi:hypothetical protein